MSIEPNQTPNKSERDTFDPFNVEKKLRAESTTWDTQQVRQAQNDDIPVVDVADYFAGKSGALETAATKLRAACEDVGFFSLTGHGIPWRVIEDTFENVRQFHAEPTSEKLALRMDRPDWPHGGMGYLPFKNAKLPARDKVNHNEAFLIKQDHNIDFDANQWPNVSRLPLFRKTIESYANVMTTLAKRLLPIYAVALNMPETFFEDAFKDPMFRLRMTHYPALGDSPSEEFGINPHVDTTFCTILAQDRAGLTIFNEQRDTWLKAPLLEQAFVVNTGELLRQWTNDRFLSVKHFANNNTSEQSRYSIPFFFNANADYVMHCVPSCHDASNPPKYPPVSYSGSQAIAQGE